MIDKKIDENGDIAMSGGTFGTVTEDDETAQHLYIALKHLIGEWFLNPKGGLKLFTRIIKRGFNEPQAAREIRRIALGVFGINRITKLKFTLDKSTRVLTLELNAVTDNAQKLYYREDYRV